MLWPTPLVLPPLRRKCPLLSAYRKTWRYRTGEQTFSSTIISRTGSCRGRNNPSIDMYSQDIAKLILFAVGDTLASETITFEKCPHPGAIPLGFTVFTPQQFWRSLHFRSQSWAHFDPAWNVVPKYQHAPKQNTVSAIWINTNKAHSGEFEHVQKRGFSRKSYCGQ